MSLYRDEERRAEALEAEEERRRASGYVPPLCRTEDEYMAWRRGDLTEADLRRVRRRRRRDMSLTEIVTETRALTRAGKSVLIVAVDHGQAGVIRSELARSGAHVGLVRFATTRSIERVQGLSVERVFVHPAARLAVLGTWRAAILSRLEETVVR